MAEVDPGDITRIAVALERIANALDGGRTTDAPTDFEPRTVDLTPREQQVAQLLALGKSRPEIADAMGISPNTVRTHVQRLLAATGTQSTLQAVMQVLRQGQIALD